MSFLSFFFSLVALHPAQAQEISFSEATQKMTSENLSVLVQQTNLSASRFQLDAAWGNFSPSVFLKGEQDNGQSNWDPTKSDYTVLRTYSANATWNLFRSGADLAGLKAAHRNLDYQSFQLDDSYLQSEAQAVTNLLQLIEKKQTVEALRRSEESLHGFLKIAEARFDKGLLPREETQKVTLDAGNAEARRADAEVQLNLAKAAVESILGHSNVKTEWPWTKNFSMADVSRLLDESPSSSAARSRPDWRAAQASMETEDYRERALFRSMLPTVDFSYSWSRYNRPDTAFSGWSTVAVLTIPLWSGLKDYSAFRVQEEARHAAEFRLRQVERDVRSTITAAQANFKISVAQFKSRTKNLETAQHILDQDTARFKMGRADANEINLDVRRVTEAEILAIQGTSQAHLAYLQLLHAFGQRVP